MAIEGDTIIMLSAEVIEKITQEYFNETMFKQKVEIVESKPTETGYMFTVAFVEVDKKAKSSYGYDDVSVQSPIPMDQFAVSDEEVERLLELSAKSLRNALNDTRNRCYTTTQALINSLKHKTCTWYTTT